MSSNLMLCIFLCDVKEGATFFLCCLSWKIVLAELFLNIVLCAILILYIYFLYHTTIQTLTMFA